MAIFRNICGLYRSKEGQSSIASGRVDPADLTSAAVKAVMAGGRDTRLMVLPNKDPKENHPEFRLVLVVSEDDDDKPKGGSEDGVAGF